MGVSILFYNTENQRGAFQLQSGTRPWGILMLTTAGRYTLELPEKKLFFTAFPNTITYIPPNTLFVRRIEEPIDFHQFHLQCGPDDLFSASLIPGVLPIPKEQVGAIGRSLLCANTAERQSDLYQHLLEHILMENYLFSSQALYPSYSNDIVCVLRYMQEHLSEQIKLKTLSEIAGLSTSGLIWKFQQQLKTTPSQHFIQLRMQRAKQLLLETSLSITQIAEKCGYNDGYYFSNAFARASV